MTKLARGDLNTQGGRSTGEDVRKGRADLSVILALILQNYPPWSFSVNATIVTGNPAKQTMTSEHITDERLSELASEPHSDASQHEESHMSDCGICIRLFIEAVKKLNED